MSLKRKKNIKFLILYNSFSESEKKEFKKFIKKNPSGNNRNYTKILSALYTNENGIVEFPISQSDRTRWNRISELSRLADKFLILKSLESDKFEKEILLLKEYNRRSLTSTFEQNYNSLYKEIIKEPIVNFDYNSFNVINNIYLYHLKSFLKPDNFVKKISNSNNLKTGVYLIDLLEYLIKIDSLKMAGVKFPDSLEEDIFVCLDFGKILNFYSKRQKSKDKLYFILKFLYLIYLNLKNPDENENYNAAKGIFFKELKSVSKEKRSVFYNHLMSLVIQRANHFIPGSPEELFNLIKHKLKEGLTDDLTESDLPVSKFRDFLLIAVNLGEIKWANNFLKNYGPLLPPENREDHINMGKALIFFNLKKYSAVLESLDQIKRKNPFFFTDVYILKLKVLFEMERFDESHTELKNFNEYLRKDRLIPDQLRIFAKEFCKAYALLIKLRLSPFKKNFYELEYLLSVRNLIGKKWVVQKMSEIKLKD